MTISLSQLVTVFSLSTVVLPLVYTPSGVSQSRLLPVDCSIN